MNLPVDFEVPLDRLAVRVPVCRPNRFWSILRPKAVGISCRGTTVKTRQAGVGMVLVIALLSCDRAKNPYLTGEKPALDRQPDGTTKKLAAAIDANATSEIAGKSNTSDAIAPNSKTEKIGKEETPVEMPDPLKQRVGTDPAKDLGRLAKAKEVEDAEKAIYELVISGDSPDKSEKIRELIELVTTYDDSPWKKHFWAAYMTTFNRQNIWYMKNMMNLAKRLMPPTPTVPYSTMWALMELRATLDNMQSDIETPAK